MIKLAVHDHVIHLNTLIYGMQSMHAVSAQLPTDRGLSVALPLLHALQHA